MAPAADVVVILAAGVGLRMSAVSATPKPLLDLGGVTLIERVVAAFAAVGVTRFRVVIGPAPAGEELAARLRELPGLAGRHVEYPVCADAERGNGHSLAAGCAGLNEPFFLSMSDHLFDGRIVARLAETARKTPDCVHLATDGRIAEIFDLDDATKVATEGDAAGGAAGAAGDPYAKIRALGKGLATYDRIDAGLFYCPAWLPATAVEAVAGDARSVSAVMERAIRRGLMRSCPVEPWYWQDVDTPEMLVEAARRLAEAGGG